MSDPLKTKNLKTKKVIIKKDKIDKKNVNKTKLITVSICGETNSGKSSIVNLLCGRKISIVSSKIHSTRDNIKGIVNYDNTQIVFIDTPGVFKPKHGTDSEKQIVRNAWNGIRSGEKIILIVDPTKKTREGFKFILSEIERNQDKAILVINKMDLLSKEELDEFENSLEDKKELFEHIFRVSAKLDIGFVPLMEYLIQSAKESPWLYQYNEFTDPSTNTFLTEVTREVFFTNLDKEIPYNSIIITEDVIESSNDVKISQIIQVQKEGQKKIIIGKDGMMLKKLLKESAQKMKDLFVNKEVKLKFFIKVVELK